LEKLKHNEGLAKLSSSVSESTDEVKNVDCSSISFSHDTILVGSLEVSISRNGMRLLTKMGYTEGECSNVAEASKELSKPSDKEDDWNTSQYSHDSVNCRGRAKESSHC